MIRPTARHDLAPRPLAARCRRAVPGRRPASPRRPVVAGILVAVAMIGACSSEEDATEWRSLPAETGDAPHDVSSSAPSKGASSESGLSTPLLDTGAPSKATPSGRAPTALEPLESESVDAAAADVTEDADVRLAATPPPTEPVLRDALARGVRAMPTGEPGIVRAPLPSPTERPSAPVENRERYQTFDDNPTVRTADERVSTFSIDVDTGSYSNVRRFLESGTLPPRDAVRLEELVNYFDYDYPVPDGSDVPFAASTELGPSPWNPDTRLLRIGLQAYEPAPDNRPAANLVFLVDVSGSMASPDKLGLLKTSLNLLAGELTADDRVGIVVYAGASGVVLEPVAGDDRRAISRALDALAAGGSTNGEAGIEAAYRLADEHFVDGGTNRVILATDGDFNVGAAGVDELVRLIGKRRESGIALTTLGFGTGNVDDHLMERLADAGDGAYAYIDTLNEARKVLVDELESTLLTVARDVKVQLEWNPAVVAEYRLLGYTNRLLADEDFTDDRVDAGEIGAGHSVTALYEIALHGKGGERHGATRYAGAVPVDTTGGEIGALRLRYKRPGEDDSRAFERVVRARDAVDALADTSDDFRFAAAVAAFGQGLRGDTHVGRFDLEDAADLAADATGGDRFGYRSAFVRLARLAASLRTVADPLTRRHGVDDRG